MYLRIASLVALVFNTLVVFPKPDICFEDSCIVISSSSSHFVLNKYSLEKTAFTYWTIGAGIGVWYQAQQDAVGNLRFPLHLSVEYSLQQKAFSGFFDYGFYTQYIRYDFVLKPMYLTLNLKYSFIKGFKINDKNFDVFALAGPNFWYASLTDRGYPGIIEYEYKVEKDIGIGVNGGLGSSYRYKRFKLSAYFLYSSGLGQYYAGEFDKQNVYTGTYQAVVSMSYIFRKKKQKGILCPAYN
jgi:hypothetical protein